MRFISWKYSLKLDLIQHQIGNLMLFEELCWFEFYENENFPFGNSIGLQFVFKLKVFLDGVCYSSVHVFPESNYGIVSFFACNWKSFSSTWCFSAESRIPDGSKECKQLWNAQRNDGWRERHRSRNQHSTSASEVPATCCEQQQRPNKCHRMLRS